MSGRHVAGADQGADQGAGALMPSGILPVFKVSNFKVSK